MNKSRFFNVVVDVEQFDHAKTCTVSTISLTLIKPRDPAYMAVRYLHLCFINEYRHYVKEIPGSDKEGFGPTHAALLCNCLALTKPYGFRTLRKARYKHRWTSS